MLTECLNLLRIFLRLGLTSFGGPIAHLGYFHAEFVAKRKWFDEAEFADVVALCQFLPGPTSSQVGLVIGASRAGVAGAIVAWFGFTLPSALMMTMFGLGLANIANGSASVWTHGLEVVAVAVVAQALVQMRRTLCPDSPRATIAAVAAGAALGFHFGLGQIVIIAMGAVVGPCVLSETATPSARVCPTVGRGAALGLLTVFAVLVVGLTLLARATQNLGLDLYARFFRVGALVFGGGHVVLPLLKAEVVDTGLVSAQTFNAGYGAAQAVPGPLFTFAAYLGAIAQAGTRGWGGAGLALVAIFLPSFLLVLGTLPFWDNLRHRADVRRAMLGVNAAVVGLLFAAFCTPLISSSIHGPGDVILATTCFILLTQRRWPPWSVVLIGIGASGLASYSSILI